VAGQIGVNPVVEPRDESGAILREGPPVREAVYGQRVFPPGDFEGALHVFRQCGRIGEIRGTIENFILGEDDRQCSGVRAYNHLCRLR
jgi:hypothetical protein